MSYKVPDVANEILFEEKKSKFHGYASLAKSRAEALNAVSLCQQKYPDARHHCWAYLLGDPKQPKSVAMSDDGEPSGTAGKPILNVLQHNDVGDIVIVVSRYFGGIKLGAGGLVRAYSNTANQVLLSLSTANFVATELTKVEVDFSHENDLRHWLQQHNCEIDQVNYSSKVQIAAYIPVDLVKEFNAFAQFHHR
ncbi:IMPACT family protein [Glaciecola sp. 1036]|uniref:IMPACT family protein n=1 Tax=Alteromonadaceae TaxID=72275 RepID=UPI003D03978C